MPHYKDGTPANVGDLVKGTGYNVKGPDGQLAELVGKVVQVTEAESCNLAIAHVGKDSPVLFNKDNSKLGHTQIGWGVIVLPSIEYGACKDFVKIGLWLLCLGALCALCGESRAQQRSTYGQYYQTPAVNRLDQKVDGHTQYNIGRSAEPPTAEAEKLFFTVVTSDAPQSNDRERQLLGWLNNDPRLNKLRANCRFNWYVASNPHYRDRLRYKYGEALPIVNISRPDGEAVLHVTALSLPRTSGELADMADDAVNAKYAPPPVRSGLTQTQIVEDCPNCPDDRPAPPDGGGQAVEPIEEVIPSHDGPALLYAAIGVFVCFGFVALVVAVLLWPRGSAPTIF